MNSFVASLLILSLLGRSEKFVCRESLLSRSQSECKFGGVQGVKENRNFGGCISLFHVLDWGMKSPKLDYCRKPWDATSCCIVKVAGKRSIFWRLIWCGRKV